MSSIRFAHAVHTLALLAVEADRAPLSSAYIAGSVNTNPVVVRRLLQQLSHAGLVTVTPGAHGGAALARPPARIGLDEVYRAVDPRDPIAVHEGPNPACPVGRQITRVLHGISAGAASALERDLAATTLEDIVHAVTGARRPSQRGA
jgi:Rrf2 family protein